MLLPPLPEKCSMKLEHSAADNLVMELPTNLRISASSNPWRRPAMTSVWCCFLLLEPGLGFRTAIKLRIQGSKGSRVQRFDISTFRIPSTPRILAPRSQLPDLVPGRT